MEERGRYRRVEEMIWGPGGEGGRGGMIGGGKEEESLVELDVVRGKIKRGRVHSCFFILFHFQRSSSSEPSQGHSKVL